MSIDNLIRVLNENGQYMVQWASETVRLVFISQGPEMNTYTVYSSRTKKTE